MKKNFAFILAAGLMVGAAGNVFAAIIAGPLTYPGNGHEYYLLTPDTWTASEQEAESLGGTLTLIRNQAEQDWIYSTFSDYGQTNRYLWIGLRRQSAGGPLGWVTDEKSGYANWSAGNPDNAGGAENCVYLYRPNDPQAGKWNDFADNAKESAPICGVVEVPGKGDEPVLTAREKALVGDWYNNGDADHCCHIVATGNQLFAIDENRGASRLIDTPEGFLFSPHWKQHLVVQDDKILWSWGNWWSRQPVKFKTLANEPAVTHAPESEAGLKPK